MSFMSRLYSTIATRPHWGMFTLLVIFNLGCSTLKYLGEGEKTLASIEIQGLNARKSNLLKEYLKQRPNRKMLSIPLGALVHQWGERHFRKEEIVNRLEKKTSRLQRKISRTENEEGKARRRKQLANTSNKMQRKIVEGNWRMRVGEPLVVYDERSHHQSGESMKQHLFGEGFFLAQVDVRGIEISPRKMKVTYLVQQGKPYFVDSVEWEIANPVIREAVLRQSKSSFLSSGAQYDQSKLDRERNRITEQVRGMGFYEFKKEYIRFEIDSMKLGSRRLLLRCLVANLPEGEHEQFIVKDVSFESMRENEVYFSETSHEGIHYKMGKFGVNPRQIDSRVFVRPGNFYSPAATLKTRQALELLDSYRLINVSYVKQGKAGLRADIVTSPRKKVEARTEFGFVTTESQGLPGPFLVTSLLGRNFFNLLNLYKLSLDFSIQGLSGIESAERRYSLFEYGANLDVTLPFFVVPMSHSLREYFSYRHPQTHIIVGYSFYDRAREYSLSAINFELSYVARFKSKSTVRFSPLSVSYTRLNSLSEEFSDFIRNRNQGGDFLLSSSIASSISSFSSLRVTYDIHDYFAGSRKSALLDIFLEAGGAFTPSKYFPNLTVFRWNKATIDYRNLVVMRRGMYLLGRVALGIASPYGSDPVVPYDRRYYLGGSTSMRGWASRRVGPGSYGDVENPQDGTGERRINYSIERGGEVKYETNLELRKKMGSVLEFAIFSDLGNIWTLTDHQNIVDQDGDDGRFRFRSFFRDLAMDGGAGLRAKFSFILLRIDWAVQILDPAQARGHRFVLRDIRLLRAVSGSEKDRAFLRNKSAFHIAVGYPF